MMNAVNRFPNLVCVTAVVVIITTAQLVAADAPKASPCEKCRGDYSKCLKLTVYNEKSLRHHSGEPDEPAAAADSAPKQEVRGDGSHISMAAESKDNTLLADQAECESRYKKCKEDHCKK